MTAQPKLTKEEIINLLGDPADVDRDLQKFRESARSLSSKHSSMIARYPKQWIAVHQGKVRAQGRTFRSVLAQIDEKGIPRGDVIVRYIDKDERTMIL